MVGWRTLYIVPYSKQSVGIEALDISDLSISTIQRVSTLLRGRVERSEGRAVLLGTCTIQYNLPGPWPTLLGGG